MGLGPPEILMIILAIVVLFGANRIPKFARSIGKAKKEFEQGLKEGEEAEDKADSAGAAKSD
jgi:sec-independent protein translocase protein TatA